MRTLGVSCLEFLRSLHALISLIFKPGIALVHIFKQIQKKKKNNYALKKKSCVFASSVLLHV